MYEHRLDAQPPEERQIYLLSTPTVSGYGISARYDESDGRQWVVRCSGVGCGWSGPLDYWEHTEGRFLVLRCSRCGSSLDPRDGQWVAQRPYRSSGFHGYQISRLFLALPDRPEVLKGLHKTRESAHFLRHFENMDLGITSSDGTSTITREQILSACFLENYPMAEVVQPATGPYFMGVDQGDKLTVLVGRADPRHDGGKLRVVYVEELRDPARGMEAWKRVADLINQFQIKMCVIDGLPNGAPAHDLARQFPGRVLNCYYREGQRAEVVEAADVRRRAEDGHKGQPSTTERVDITVDRTETLDRTRSDLIGGKIMLPGPRGTRTCRNLCDSARITFGGPMKTRMEYLPIVGFALVDQTTTSTRSII